MSLSHQRRLRVYQHDSWSERVADTVANGIGSLAFILVQTVLVGLWIVGNVYLLTHPFDRFPFILLNLAFSTQAAYATPLILLAQKRSARRDRHLLEVEASEVDLLFKLNLMQLDILRLLHEHVAPEVGTPIWQCYRDLEAQIDLVHRRADALEHEMAAE